jgi:hypothetical protein
VLTGCIIEVLGYNIKMCFTKTVSKNIEIVYDTELALTGSLWLLYCTQIRMHNKLV